MVSVTELEFDFMLVWYTSSWGRVTKVINSLLGKSLAFYGSGKNCYADHWICISEFRVLFSNSITLLFDVFLKRYINKISFIYPLMWTCIKKVICHLWIFVMDLFSNRKSTKSLEVSTVCYYCIYVRNFGTSQEFCWIALTLLTNLTYATLTKPNIVVFSEGYT